MSSSAMSSSAMSSSEMSSGGSASITEPSSSPSSAESNSSAGSSAAVTSSGAAGFDKRTTLWFTTFCTGFGKASVANKAVAAQLKGTVTVATKPTLLLGYKTTAAIFSATALALTKLPAPTIAGGDKIATEVPKGMSQVAATISALAAESASAQPSQMVTLAEGKQATLTSEAQAVVAPIAALDAQTQQELLAVPACAELQKTVEGG